MAFPASTWAFLPWGAGKLDEATIAAKERRASASREAKRRSPAATPVKPEVSRRHVPRISATSMLSSPKKKAAASATRRRTKSTIPRK